MKSSLFLIALLCVFVAGADDDKYSTKYDNIDLEEILGNKRLLQKYIDCVLDKGPCTKDGEELKSHITDALETDCVKCSETQEKGGERVVKYLIKNENAWWQELIAKYDPEGKYQKKYEDLLKNIDS